eukprot:COSAG01_NODE_628_length_14690_cov_1156.936947_3_plen_108_part_00
MTGSVRTARALTFGVTLLPAPPPPVPPPLPRTAGAAAGADAAGRVWAAGVGQGGALLGDDALEQRGDEGTRRVGGSAQAAAEHARAARVTGRGVSVAALHFLSNNWH